MGTIKEKSLVVMLPTEEASCIYRTELEDRPTLQKDSGEKVREDYKRMGYFPQHIYFLSDDEVKDGEWCINPNGFPEIFGHDFGAIYTKKEILSCKKIVGATNSSMKLYEPHPEFFDPFIKMYNDGDIDEVLLEYEFVIGDNNGEGTKWHPRYDVHKVLKVGDNNTFEVFFK